MSERVERLEFWVDGIPIPQGSHKVFNGHVVDANKGLKDWRSHVYLTAKEALFGRDGFDRDAEVFVLLDFYMPRGKTVKRRRPTTRPDIDKCVRGVLDSLTAASVFFDDGQVVSIHAQQWYADDKPGVHVVVGELA